MVIHFNIGCVCVLSCSVMSDSLRLYGLKPTRLLCPWNSPGKLTGVSCHSLLQVTHMQGYNYNPAPTVVVN